MYQQGDKAGWNFRCGRFAAALKNFQRLDFQPRANVISLAANGVPLRMTLKTTIDSQQLRVYVTLARTQSMNRAPSRFAHASTSVDGRKGSGQARRSSNAKRWAA